MPPPLPVAILSVSPVLKNLLAKSFGEHPEIEVVAAGDFHGYPAGNLAVTAAGSRLLLLDFDPSRAEDLRRAGEIRSATDVPILAFVPALSSSLAETLRRDGFPVVRRRPDLLSLTTTERLEPLYLLMRAVVEGSPIARSSATISPAPKPVPERRSNVPPPVARDAPAAPPALIVVIGASTGGPQVVRRVLQDVPIDERWAIAIVQHISPAFAEGFARWLTETTDHTVTIATDGGAITGGCVVVAPGDTHLTVSRSHWHLDHRPKRLFQRPSVDNLFESAARAWSDRTIGVLLTGMGRDGGEGCLAITGAGGHTIVQDEATSAVYGMPRAAVENGGASEVVGLESIGERVVHALRTRKG